MGESLNEAISSKRLHHQLLPMEVVYEKNFDSKIIEGLRQMGHKVVEDKPAIGFTAFTAISRARGYIEAAFDSRRYGSIEMN